MSAIAMLEKTALDRHELHVGHASSRPLSPDYELVGLSGEWEFAKLIGVMPDLSRKPGGDKGIDFIIPLRFSVDVKSARKAVHLIHEQGKRFADIYVLAEFNDDSKEANLIGWEFGKALASAPVRDFGYGVINHYIHRDNLRKIPDLASRLMRLA